MATAEKFLADVRWHLTYPDESRYQATLDIMLLGGTVPAEPIRVPNPECSDCWGDGWVCSCHGFGRRYSLSPGSGCYLERSFEKCKCWRPINEWRA